MTNDQTSDRTTETRAHAPKADPMFGMPFGPFTPEAFSTYARDHLARMEAWLKELAQLEAAMLTRARASTAQLAQLAQESLDYAAQLSAEWRKLAVDATRRASETVAPKA